MLEAREHVRPFVLRCDLALAQGLLPGSRRLNALLYSLGFCVVAAALEGVFAGSGIKQRLAELRSPRYALPLWGWVIVGVLYYVICFAVLYRLFSLPSALALRNSAIGLLGGIMLVNALWNYFFFRTRNLFHAFAIGLPYIVAVLVLFALLLWLDLLAAWCLLAYLLYLPYASLLVYRMWKLNPPGA